MTIIHFKGTAKQLRSALARVAKAAGGRSSSRAAQKMMRDIGEEVLDIVSKAFIEKSAGGTDEAGLHWRPLSAYTVAYRRRYAGVLWPPKSRAKYAPSYALKAKQRKKWWSVYYRLLTAYKGNKGSAAAGAWRILRAEGATTLMDLYGGSHALILSETGKLLNSLLPSHGSRRKYQVFRVRRGSVEVGTSRPWNQVHMHGSATVPQRRLWAEIADWPQSWWTRINKRVMIGIGEITKELLGKP